MLLYLAVIILTK